MEKLFPYQETGAVHLATRNYAYLADDMGLGKSAQAIRACDDLLARTIVVVCPASVRENWRREFEQFSLFDRPVSVLYTGKDHPCPGGITITSFDLLAQKHVRDRILALEEYVLITDEAHMLKGRKTRRTKAVLGDPRTKAAGLADRASHWWCLSGTPTPNTPDELWPVLRKVGLYRGDYWSFIDRYCQGYDNGFGFRVTGGKNLPELRKLLQGYLLRRKKEDVMGDLPPLTSSFLNVDPGNVDTDAWFPWSNYGDQQEIYHEIRKQGQAVMAVLNTCQGEDAKLQAIESLISSNTGLLRRFVGLAKVDPVVEILSQELDADPERKVVIFCMHRDAMTDLKMKMRRFRPVQIYGGTPPQKRQDNIDRFHNDPKCRVFIGQMIAAGTGINLQGAASQVVMLEPDWVPGNNAQAIMRVHRIGQTEPVTVRWVRCRGAAVDEKVVGLLRNKTRTITELFDTNDQEANHG